MDQGSSDVNLIDIQHHRSLSIFGVNPTATMQDERNSGAFCDLTQEVQIKARAISRLLTLKDGTAILFSKT